MSLSPHQSQQSIRRLTAGVMGLSGFMVAILSGMNAGNPTGSVLVTGIVCMVVCHIAGSIIGMILETVLDEHRRSLAASDVSKPPVETGIEIGEPVEFASPETEQNADVSRAAA